VEAKSIGGQGSRRAVAPGGDDDDGVLCSSSSAVQLALVSDVGRNGNACELEAFENRPRTRMDVSFVLC
jgi:hypothetical protein